MNKFLPRWLLLGALMLVGTGAPAAAAPTGGSSGPRPLRVLVINSFGEHFEPFRSAASAFRTQLALQSPGPVEFYDISLQTARFDEQAGDGPFIAYIHALFPDDPPGLVVAIGSPAARFCMRQRSALFNDVPVLIAATEERHLKGLDPGPRTGVSTFRLDLPGFMSDILALLPDTRHAYVILGDSPLEHFWAEQSKQEWQTFSDRVEFTWLGGLSFSEMVRRLSSLPPHSVIIYGQLTVDAAGVPYEQKQALQRIHDVANAPMFGFFVHDLGDGIVGGRLADVDSMGARAAREALRMVNGQQASVSAPPAGLTEPRYDGRELRRWQIERRVPPGSTMLFREKTRWEAYRWHFMVLVAFIVLQAMLTLHLVRGRHRLRTAQADAQNLRRELAHSGRVSLMGQLMASISHELGQPLGAILRNADAAELFLKSGVTDVEELRAIVGDIRRDDERASAVIKRMRSLLSRRDIDMQPQDVAQVVSEVMTLMHADAESRHVEVEVDVAPNLPPVRGDRVHLQQVLINLVVNAMDAVEKNGHPRRVVLSARRDGDGMVAVTVRDRGPGVAPERLRDIFDPFVSTKPEGMGMGLPISKSIVEAHGGRIWVENDAGGGAAFHFTVPVVNGGGDGR